MESKTLTMAEFDAELSKGLEKIKRGEKKTSLWGKIKHILFGCSGKVLKTIELRGPLISASPLLGTAEKTMDCTTIFTACECSTCNKLFVNAKTAWGETVHLSEYQQNNLLTYHFGY